MRMFVEIGEEASFAKTVAARDLDLFSEITGDFDPIHVDDAYAAKSRFGRRIAHGALVMGLLSTTASMISRRAVERGSRGVSVSLGYDRIRFLQPVFIGDALTASYRIEEIDAEAGRSRSRVEVVNQKGEICLAGTHVMKWLPPDDIAGPDPSPAGEGESAPADRGGDLRREAPFPTPARSSASTRPSPAGEGSTAQQNDA